MPRVAPELIVAGLVKRGVPQHVAEGVVMNFQDESGLDTGIQEQNPTRGRGGFGLAQWTGPRRIALEDFATSQARQIDDPELQLDYFMHENAGPEAAAWKAVMNSPDRNTAAVNFVNKWERPAAQHAAARTAKYTGAGDSPSEGGGRFGGSGLGTPAAEAPVAAPEAPKAPVNKWKEFGKDMLSGLGGGGGGAVSAPSSGIGELPKAVMAQTNPTTIGGGGGYEAELKRQSLAQIMSRLNSGKLF